MAKKISILLGFTIGLILLGLAFNHRADGIVDLLNYNSYEPVSMIGHIEKSAIPEVTDSYKSHVSYSSAVRTTSNTGYGSATFIGNYISVTGRNISIVDVGSTTVDAGNHVNKYGSRFYYGHNSGAVFGGLTGLDVGSSFSIYYGGVLHNYRVAKVMIFEKNISNGRLQLNGSGSYMKSVSEARGGGVQYDISLMTCYGTSYGYGDASHRLVVFANEL